MTGPDIDADIEQSTAYCTYCPKMCRFSCPTAHAEGRETVTPWGMMRLFELTRDGSVTLDDEIAQTFFHCTGCRRCQSFCAHDNDVPRALWKARQWVVDAGFLPEPYVALHQRFERSGNPYGETSIEFDDSPFDAEATVGFWPDCSTVEHRPHLIEALGRLLSTVLGDKVRLIDSADFDRPPCCGFPLTGAGLENAESCRDERWPSLSGLEQIWTDCPALAAWQKPDSSWAMAADDDHPDIGHIFDLLADRLPDLPAPTHCLQTRDALLHQSCLVSRQLKALDQVDTILSHICVELPQSMAYEGEESQCCGGRCHYQILEPQAARKAAETVLEARSRNEGATRIVTTSSMCRQAMQEASETDGVSSLLELVCQAYGWLDR